MYMVKMINWGKVRAMNKKDYAFVEMARRRARAHDARVCAGVTTFSQQPGTQ
jgi:hypothetical protein